jgi:hypothetical protein
MILPNGEAYLDYLSCDNYPMTATICRTVSQLPTLPGVYVMFGGKGSGLYAAYIGIAGTSLRGRIEQHLVRRDSSVATGVAAACLNPSAITQVWWWTNSEFRDRTVLEASELVAFEVFEPALRSRGGIREEAKRLAETEQFAVSMRQMLSEAPTGKLVLPTLIEALDRIDQLEKRLEKLEAQLNHG